LSILSLLGNIRKAIQGMSNLSLAVTVVMGVAVPNTAGASVQGYSAALRRVAVGLQRLESLYPELDSLLHRQNRTTELELQIVAKAREIADAKRATVTAMQQLSFLHDDVVKEKTLGPRMCYDVFSFQHNQVVQYGAGVAALPVPVSY
jgi:hypothetical protein